MAKTTKRFSTYKVNNSHCVPSSSNNSEKLSYLGWMVYSKYCLFVPVKRAVVYWLTWTISQVINTPTSGSLTENLQGKLEEQEKFEETVQK